MEGTPSNSTMLGTGRPAATAATVGVWALCCAILTAHAATFLPFLGDDALISLRYAERLLDGYGLTWTDGERVEGYSNLLWVLSCAGLGALGMDLITAARALGFLGMFAAVGAVLATFPVRRGRPALPALVGPLTLALAPPVALWTVGGLAPPLVLALLGWAVFAVARGCKVDGDKHCAVAGVLLGLLAITRPDGGLFAALTALWLWLGSHRRSALLVAVPTLVTIGGQMLFRVVYYGDWLPNTAYVKATPSLARAVHGLVHYTVPGTVALAGAVALAAAGAFIVLRRRDHSGIGSLCLLLLVAWTGYVTAVGGDYMPAWRHFCPALLLAAFLAALGAEAISLQRTAAWSVRAAWAAPLLLLLVLAQLWDGETARARTERWEWDGQLVGRFLAEAFADRRPLLAVEAAGTVPYFSGLPCIDLLGLNDRHIARQPTSGLYPPSHDHGDGDYVLGREPDLVLFATPDGAFLGQSLSAVQMQRDPRFAAGYRFCTFETPEGFRSGIWVRVEGRAGVQRDGTIWVPGHLLGSEHLARLGDDPEAGVTTRRADPSVVGELAGDGTLRARLRAEEAALLGLEVPAGRWQARVEPAGTGLQAGLRLPGDGPLPRAGEAQVVPGGARLDLTVRGGGKRPVAFRGVRLLPR